MENESEALVQQAATPTPSEIAFDSQHAVKRAENIIKAMDSVIKLALLRTNYQDWVRMGKGLYLQESGAMKVRPVFGIYFRDLTIAKENHEDGSYAYTSQVTCGSTVLDKWYGTEATIEQIGTRSSRDTFFTGKDGRKEADEQDVKKAAIANCRGRAIVALLGLQNMSDDDLRKVGVDVSKIAGVEYKTGSQGGATASGTDKEIQVKLYNLMTKHYGTSDEAALSKYLQELTSFVGKDGKKVTGKSSLKDLTGKWLQSTYGKMKQLAEAEEQTITDNFEKEEAGARG